MKLTFYIIVLFFFIYPLHAETEQPPYEVPDPAISENFREIYLTMDQHKHKQDGSSRLEDIIPASSSTYNLGSSSSSWARLYVGSITATGVTNLNGTLNINGTALSSTTAIMHASGFNSTLGTGATFAAFVPDENIRLRRITTTIVVAGIAGSGDQWICGDGVNKLSVITEAAATAGSTISSGTMTADITRGSTVYFRLDSGAATTPTANVLLEYIKK